MRGLLSAIPGEAVRPALCVANTSFETTDTPERCADGPVGIDLFATAGLEEVLDRGAFDINDCMLPSMIAVRVASTSQFLRSSASSICSADQVFVSVPSPVPFRTEVRTSNGVIVRLAMFSSRPVKRNERGSSEESKLVLVAEPG